MSNFLERIKADRTLQAILGLGFIICIFLFIFVLKPILFRPKPPQLPCYNQTLVIWLPFPSFEVNDLFSDFTKFCVRFEIVEKSLDQIKNEIPLIPFQEKAPDIVYIDDEILNLYKDLFATPTPMFVDALVAYYNKNILSFLNLEPPKTFDELKNFAQKIRDYQKDFYVAGVGTKDIKHRNEIILSLMSLNENYQDKTYLVNNLISALDLYQSFSNPQSQYFFYPLDAGNDLENFANERLALYLGFYQDKKEILKLNPRINYVLSIYPLNTFPPKSKIYSKFYYLAIVKKPKTAVAQIFIDWFLKNSIEKFSQTFDLVPFVEGISLTSEKKIVFDSAKNYGETFEFLNKKILFDNLDRIIEETDPYQRQKLIYEIIYQL